MHIKTPLQYAFLMDHDGRLLACDTFGEDFLKSIDLELFYLQLHSIKINDAITSTTIVIEHTSYNLRLVPLPSGIHTPGRPKDPTPEYIVVLQNQAIFSTLYKSLTQLLPLLQEDDDLSSTHQKKLMEIFDSLLTGIFITNANGEVIFVNSIYEKKAGLKRRDVLNRKLTDLKQSGVLNILIAPVVLETGEILTTIQRLSTGKNAVISGAPIYDSSGKPILAMTCVTIIEHISPIDSSADSYDPADFLFADNDLLKEGSIDIIAESKTMKAIIQDIIKAAHYDVTVLLLGESGVGKEVISSILHTSSMRNKEKFVKINCSAISPALLESELFGYEAGAFTGASNRGKPGLFEIANNGTLLLDEIGDLPMELQAKLLRALQSREIYRVGGLSPIKINVRIIASTNQDLEKCVERGEFRQDLFYRLNVVSIEIPPLRSRREDILPLLLHFCYVYNRKYSTNKRFSAELLYVLESYQWPGNIRELQNVVERLIVLCPEEILLPQHFYSKYKPHNLPCASDEDIVINKIMPLSEAVGITERILVERALTLCKSTRGAAELLEVSQSTIMRKIKEHAIRM